MLLSGNNLPFQRIFYCYRSRLNALNLTFSCYKTKKLSRFSVIEVPLFRPSKKRLESFWWNVISVLDEYERLQGRSQSGVKKLKGSTGRQRYSLWLDVLACPAAVTVHTVNILVIFRKFTIFLVSVLCDSK